MVHPHRLATGTQIEAPSRRFYFAATSSDSAVAMPLTCSATFLDSFEIMYLLDIKTWKIELGKVYRDS